MSLRLCGIYEKRSKNKHNIIEALKVALASINTIAPRNPSTERQREGSGEKFGNEGIVMK